MTLADQITTRLQVLTPTTLELTDDSAQHAGHQGNTGGGHFKLRITSSHFCEKSQIMRHRMIYQLLADLMPTSIHALSIQAFGTDDLKQS